MKLSALFAELDIPIEQDLEIEKIAADSRAAGPGTLFVALRGTLADGHQYLVDAASRGAAAAIGEIDNPGLEIPYFRLPDTRLALAQLAAAWHQHPGRRMLMIGITGTDGKTTTATLLHHILLAAGYHTGLVSTVNAVIGDRVKDTGFHVTTPDALDVQSLLAEMVAAGITHCILETTSHGLGQQRVAACAFDIGVITNITHEHLDYHGSYEAYRAAKGLLFSGLGASPPKLSNPQRLAVLNQDDSSFAFLSSIATAPIVTYAAGATADVVAHNVRRSAAGLFFTIHDRRGEWAVRSPLVGMFNLSNILAAYSAAVEGLGVEPQTAVEAIADVSGVPGRMERIDLGQKFTAIVDFAHTPNALQRALESVRQLSDGRVIAVFGSAGLRDRQKRKMMARVSAELADITVITAEDPRSESLDEILAEMAAGAREVGGQEGETLFRVPDRGQALRFAVGIARPNDLVISCGKGHEQSMCFGVTEYPWDDRTAMRAALSELLGVEGPPMPSLPTSV